MGARASVRSTRIARSGPIEGNDAEKFMAKKTPATNLLDAAGIAYSLHTYDYDPNAERIGLQAAESLGVPGDHVVKSLMALVDGKPVCAMVRSDREVNLKKLANAVGGKSAQMMKPADAERMSGYRIGGISPFGQRRAVMAIMDEDAYALAEIFLNGGQRGLQIKINPADAISILHATVAQLT
jgi:Cys-tRNA(Pro)/Cys-tRNA(Cys) deacylase